MLDQPERALRDRSSSCLDSGRDVVRWIDRLADIVEQGRQQEVLVVGPGLPGKFKHPECAWYCASPSGWYLGFCLTPSSGNRRIR